MNIEIMPCTVEHIEKLIEGADAFAEAYELQVVDGYLPVEAEGILQYNLNEMQAGRIWHPWLSYTLRLI